MAIRVITFDWGDTLAANHAQPYNSIMDKAFERLGADLEHLGARLGPRWAGDRRAALEEDWSRTFDPATNPDHREFDWNGLLGRWIAAAGVAPDHPALHAARIRYGRTLTDTLVPFADARPTLRRLAAAGYRLGILSHVPWPGWACRDWFRRWHLAPFIAFYSLSSEVGWIKPNLRHYAHALERAGCEPGAVLHVGDHPLRDIRGARAAGCRTCLRRTQGIYPEEDLRTCAPDLAITGLAELPAAVARLG